MKTYDMIFLADDEYGNDVMEQVAREHFAANPDCQFIVVYEHAGWFLGYRRDMSICATANDGAALPPGPRPERFSGVEIRRRTMPKACAAA